MQLFKGDSPIVQCWSVCHKISAKGQGARIYLMVDDKSTDKGIKIILRRNGGSCIKDSANSQCLHDGVDTEGILSEDQYSGFWVQTKLTSDGHMEVTRN